MKRPTKLDWLVYRFFRWWWNPILQRDPLKVIGIRNTLSEWIETYFRELPAPIREEDRAWARKCLKEYGGQVQDPND